MNIPDSLEFYAEEHWITSKLIPFKNCTCTVTKCYLLMILIYWVMAVDCHTNFCIDTIMENISSNM